MSRLVAFFAPHCSERSTLDELGQMIINHKQWSRGHDLFDRIRHKRLVAHRNGDHTKAAQYLFEEICAKTLYNLTHPSAPFDPDSPYCGRMWGHHTQFYANLYDELFHRRGVYRPGAGHAALAPSAMRG